MVVVWVPKELVEALDQYVQQHDSDRSKVIRAALKAKLGVRQMEAA